ncbi:MAG: hypothetical protein OEM38_02450 [Gammaproteobacteria bacterium]|nr:hypothetical protein [Gammaproteobacteria bacterium]
MMEALKVIKQFRTITNTFFFYTTLLWLMTSNTLADELTTPEFTGLFSASAAGSYQKDNNDKKDKENNTDSSLTSLHQQDLRLMIDGNNNTISYELHSEIITTTQSSNIQNNTPGFQNIFQFNDMKYQLIQQQNNSTLYTGQIKADRLNIKANFETVDFRIGRQAISWGVGRFWQPTDIFGAFNAAELVRDYKTGIDVFNFNYYPNSFSNINLVYAFSANNNSNIGLRYAGPVSESIYLSLITANIEEDMIIGGSLESDWNGAGIRLESIAFPSEHNNNYQLYSVAGFDYQFENEWLLTTEIHYNNRGANSISEFENIVSGKHFQAGRLKQLSQQLIGISLQKSVTPLISVNYLWINAFLTRSQFYNSALHQLSAVYSLSNESDIRFTFITTTGKQVNNIGIPQSEFGHIPITASFLLRMYF